jgi:uncharacterized protein (TIGR00730 family)
MGKAPQGNAKERAPVVAVFGSSTLRESDPAYAAIQHLGGELARAGYSVMTGGYDGAMAAASRGADEAGGHVIGVTVDLFEARGAVNPWVRERVHVPDLPERLRYLAANADAFVIVTGSIGTLTELFLCWTLVAVGARPVAPLILMGPHWHAWVAAHRTPDFITEHLFRWIEVADTPEDAVRRVAVKLASAPERRSAGAPA